MGNCSEEDIPICKKYLFITRKFVVDKQQSFVAIQRVYGAEMLHHVFNSKSLLTTLESYGMKLIR